MDVYFSKVCCEVPTVRKLFGALTVIHSVISVVVCKILHISWQAFAVQFSVCCISFAEPTEQLASECHQAEPPLVHQKLPLPMSFVALAAKH